MPIEQFSKAEFEASLPLKPPEVTWECSGLSDGEIVYRIPVMRGERILTLPCECNCPRCHFEYQAPASKVTEVLRSGKQYLVAPEHAKYIFPEDEIIEVQEEFAVVVAPMPVMSR